MRSRQSSSRRSSVVVVAGSLAALAGGAQSLGAVFTFQPNCTTPTWAQTCDLANGCGAGVTLFRNNWAIPTCGVPNMFPGASDDVIFPVGGLIDTTQLVRTLTINAGASVTSNVGVNTSNGTNILGTLTMLAGNSTLSGPIDIAGTFIENGGGWGRTLSGNPIDVAGTLDFPGSVGWGGTPSPITIEATGQVRKLSGGTATLTGHALTLAGDMLSSSGDLTLNGGAVVCVAGSAITTTSGADVNINGARIAGPFTMSLSASGDVTFNSTFTTAGAPATLNASGAPAVVTAGMTAAAGGTITNTGQLLNAAGNQTFAGAFVNSSVATWTDNNAGWTRTMSSLALTNAGSVVLPGSTVWSGAGTGTIATSGSIRKNAGGTATLDRFAVANSGLVRVDAAGGTLQFTNGAFVSQPGATYQVAGGSLEWNSQTMAGAFGIAASGGGATSASNWATSAPVTINLTPAGNETFVHSGTLNTTAGLLTNAGSMTLAAGNQSWTGPVTNAATGTLTDNGAGWNRSLTNVALSNAGTWNMPASTDWVNASGSTISSSGTIHKSAGGTANISGFPLSLQTGSVTRVSNGNLALNTLPVTFAGQVQLQGGGQISLNNCTSQGAIQGTSDGVSSRVNLSGSLTTSAPLTLSVPVGGVLLSANVNASAGGLTNNGVLTVNAGNQTWSGSFTNTGIMTENNAGWNRTMNNCTFVNSATGTMGFPGSADWLNAASPSASTILNQGSMLKSAGGIWQVTPAFTQTASGSLSITSGDVHMNGNTTQWDGPVTINGANTLLLTSNTIRGTLGVGTDNASGRVLSQGTLSTAAPTIINVTGPGAWQINSNLNATGGTLTNAGRAVGIDGNQAWTGAFVNSGVYTENNAGWNRTFTNATVTNSGSMTFPGSADWLNGGASTFASSGTFNKTAGGVGQIALPTTNTGQIDVQSGTLNFSGGLTQSGAGARAQSRATTTLQGTVTANGGRIEGAGRILGTLTVGGATIDPGDNPTTGTLLVQGNAGMSSASTLEIDLNARPASNSDRLRTTGNVAVAGSLRVVVDPTFVPILGDTYEIVRSDTANGRTGTFLGGVTLVAPSGVSVAVTYTPTTVLLTITDTICDQIDFNNDGLFPDDQDLVDFLSVFAGGACSTDPTPGCADIDFNNDGLFPDDADLLAFLSLLAGGAC